jgi:hypothetical protein
MSGWHREFSSGPTSPLVYKIMFEKEEYTSLVLKKHELLDPR